MSRDYGRRAEWRPFRARVIELVERAAQDGSLPRSPCERCGGADARLELALGSRGIHLSWRCPPCSADVPHLPAPSLAQRVDYLEAGHRTLEAEVASLRALVLGGVPVRPSLTFNQSGTHHNGGRRRQKPKET